MDEIFFYIIRILSLVTLAVSIVLAIKNWFSSLKEIRILTIYLCLVLVNELVSQCLIHFSSLSNIFLFYVYSFFEVVLFSLVYKTALNKFHVKYLKQIVFIMVLMLGSFVLYEGWMYVNKGVNEVYGKLISNIWIILLSGLYLVNQLKSNSVNVKCSFDRINLIILFYFSVSLVAFSIMNQLPNLSKESAYVIWGINNVFCFLFYFVFLRSFNK
jgi:hypothetical protein